MRDLPKRLVIPVFLIASLAAGQGRAQSLDERYWIEASVMWADLDTRGDFRLPKAPEGGQMDFERDLGMDDRETLAAISGGYRHSERLTINADIYRLDRSSTEVLKRDIPFEIVTFPATATIDSSFRSDIYRLTLGYSLIRRDNLEAGAAVGLHANDFDIRLAGRGKVGPVEVEEVVRRRTFLAPLPTAGVYGVWRPTPKVTFNGRADYLSLSLGDYHGGVLNMQAGAAYAVSQRVDLGVMYRYVDYDLSIEKRKWAGGLRYQFSGPAVFVRARF